MAGEGSQTLDRGLRILEVLAREETADGMTVSELAALLQVGRPVVYRLVATLEEHQLVTRHEGRVRLGLGMHRLAGAALPALRQRARPSLRHLADAVGATAHLTVVEGSEAVALVVVEPSTTDFHVAYRTGARHALDRGAAGRAILAARDGDPRLVRTVGDLQQGAHGLAVALSAGAGGVHLEASVGVIALHEMDATEVEPAIRTAAEELAEAT